MCGRFSFLHCMFLSSPIYDISVRMSFILSSLNSSYHLFFLLRSTLFFLLLLKLPLPLLYTVLLNPKIPKTVSVASSIISLYFSLSYSSKGSVVCATSSIGTTLQRGLLSHKGKQVCSLMN